MGFSGESIGIVVLLSLTVLGSEVIFLETQDPVGHLSLQILETHEPS
jgi:hypothetical protein